MSNNRKNKGAALVVISIILLGIIAAGGVLVYNLFFGQGTQEAPDTANTEEIDFFEHYGHLDNRRINVVMRGDIVAVPTAPVFIDGGLHLPADFLRQYIDRYIFWEANTGRLTITNMDQVTRFYPNDTTYTLNWEEQQLVHPIRELGGMAFMAADMVMQRYPVTITYQEEYNLVLIDFHRYARTFYTVAMDESGEESWAALRFGPNNQYPIMARLFDGDRVLYIEAHREYNEEGENGEYSRYWRVRTESGLVGYISADNLSRVNYIPAVPQMEQRRPITRPFDGHIHFTWHHMGVNNPDTWVVPPGLNAISPVWFSFDEDPSGNFTGNITSWVNNQYLAWARANGIEVWPMIWDATSDGAFSAAISRAVLTNAYVRDNVIAQLMEFIRRYNLDGIQVDFEAVQEDFADEWIQFLRELAVPMRQAGAVLSAATKVPMPHNMFWNRTEIGLTVDYVMIMAYDEHWRTSPTAGPVASFTWVQHAVRATLEEVPREQIIVGLPTYVNIWREEIIDGEWRVVNATDRSQDNPVARQISMNFARSFMTERGATSYWDYILRQYYYEVEFTENGVEMRYRAWLDDARSMDEKLSILNQYNLAGVGFWQKYLAHAWMWDLVYEHLN